MRRQSPGGNALLHSRGDGRPAADDEVFVDAGAHHGSVIEAFIRQTKGAFKQIVAIEPDPFNRARLAENLRALAAGRSAGDGLRLRACRRPTARRHSMTGSTTPRSSPAPAAMRVTTRPLDALGLSRHLCEAASRRRRTRRLERRPANAADAPPDRRRHRLSQRRRHLGNAALADGHVARLSISVPRPCLVRQRRRRLRHTQ